MKVEEYAVAHLLKNGMITEEEQELYRFGINRLFLFFMNLLTAAVIGKLFGMLWQSLLFSIVYIPLRRFAGGFHVRSARLCYALSTVLILMMLVVIQYLPENVYLITGLLTGADCIILRKAPKGTVARPLSQAERKVFRTRTVKILMIENILTIITLVLQHEIAMCIVMGIVCSAGMLFPAERKEGCRCGRDREFGRKRVPNSQGRRKF